MPKKSTQSRHESEVEMVRNKADRAGRTNAEDGTSATGEQPVVSRTAAHTPLVEQSIGVLSSPPFPCVNCDKATPSAFLYCSELCDEEASFVRYYRKRKGEGSQREKEIQIALRVRLAMILGGGYPKRQRTLTPSIRKTVIARDNGICRTCGEAGSEIDHMFGGNNDLDNLQLLCNDCHNQKTIAGFTKITAETHPVEWAKREGLLARVHSSEAIRLCDGTDWPNLWAGLQKARQDRANPPAQTGFNF